MREFILSIENKFHQIVSTTSNPLQECHPTAKIRVLGRSGGDESVSTSSSVIPIIPRVSVSSVYLYGPFQQAHPQVSSPFPKDQKREWSHPPVRGSVVSSSFPGTPARTGYTFLHVRSNCPHNIHRRCTFFSMFPTSLSRMALMLCCG